MVKGSHNNVAILGYSNYCHTFRFSDLGNESYSVPSSIIFTISIFKSAQTNMCAPESSLLAMSPCYFQPPFTARFVRIY